jgi:predicted esterase YcpF (UPF0227 family)
MESDLKQKIRIYYIHGYLSGPNSRKGILFKEKLDVIPISYRECEPEKLVISDCLLKIISQIKNDKEIILIGSSFGGFLSLLTAKKLNQVKKLILLNPSIIPPKIDIKKLKNMPQRILKDMKDIRLFKDRLNCEIYIILGSEDNVVPNSWSIEFAKSQEANILFLNDDHSLSKNMNKLPQIIKKFINKNN